MTINGLINDIASLTGIGGPSFLDQLLPASWRGLPFFVTASRFKSGRKSAVHDYPNRDAVWVEDLGRGRTTLHITGYIVGDDVIAQSKQLIFTLNKPNSEQQKGTLVHPRLGTFSNVALIDLAILDTIEGRYTEVEFTFMGTSRRIFPVAAVSTAAATTTAAAGADSAASTSFASQVGAVLKQGGAIVKSVVAAVQKYGGLVFRLVNDATSLVKTVQALPGEFGRFFAGASSTLFGLTSSVSSSSATIPSLIAAGAQARAAVTVAMTAAQAGAAALDAASAPSFAAQTQSVTAALAAATVDPADQVRLFTDLAGFVPPIVQGSAAAMAAEQLTTDLWRRAALTALARATALYQPSSYEDAAALRSLVVDLLEDEIDIAGDQGEDDVFLAFRALKAAVAADLTSRGATLSPIVTVSFAAALPAPLLAMKLYQDASRANELIGEANVRHPAFMPTSFKALAR